MKEAAESIARNTAAMMVSQLITWASSLVLMLFLPRYLGDEAYGKLYFCLSITSLMGMIVDLGIGSFLVKEVARDHTKAGAYIINAAALKTLAWAAGFILVSGFAVWNGYPSDTVTMVLVLGFGKLLEGFSDLAQRVFQGYERLQYRSVAIVVEKVFLSAAGVTMLLLGFQATMIAVVMVIGMLLNLAVSLFLLPRLVHFQIVISPSIWPVLLRGGMPFFVASAFAFIYFRIDVLLLSLMANDRVVGWYGAPHRLFDTLMFFPSILQIAVYPVLSRLWQSSKDGLYQTSRKVLDLTLIVGVPITVLLGTLARPIVSVLFGLKDFSQSVILLQALSLSLVLIYVDFVLSTVIISADKQKQLSYIAMIATGINLAVNVLLIPYCQRTFGNGAIGACIATLVTEVSVMGMSLYLLPRGCFNRENLKVVGKTAFAGLLMAGTIWWVEAQWQFWVASAAMGTMVYGALLFLVKVVSKKDVTLFLRVLPRRRPVMEPVPNK